MYLSLIITLFLVKSEIICHYGLLSLLALVHSMCLKIRIRDFLVQKTTFLRVSLCFCCVKSIKCLPRTIQSVKQAQNYGWITVFSFQSGKNKKQNSHVFLWHAHLCLWLSAVFDANRNWSGFVFPETQTLHHSVCSFVSSHTWFLGSTRAIELLPVSFIAEE